MTWVKAGSGVGPPADAVDDLRAREELAVQVPDAPPWEGPPGRDDLRVVRPDREVLRLDHLPPRDAGGDDPEGEHQVQAQAAHVRGDHGPASASVPMALRWLIDRRRPIMMKLASTLDPP